MGAIACFTLVVAKHGGSLSFISPGFKADKSSILQIVSIVVLAPWAYIGFESVSHSTNDFKFPVKKSILIMGIAIATAAIAYVLLSFVATGYTKEGATNWTETLNDGLLVFKTMDQTLPTIGLIIVGVTVTIVPFVLGNVNLEYIVLITSAMFLIDILIIMALHFYGERKLRRL